MKVDKTKRQGRISCLSPTKERDHAYPAQRDYDPVDPIQATVQPAHLGLGGSAGCRRATGPGQADGECGAGSDGTQRRAAVPELPSGAQPCQVVGVGG